MQLTCPQRKGGVLRTHSAGGLPPTVRLGLCVALGAAPLLMLATPGRASSRPNDGQHRSVAPLSAPRTSPSVLSTRSSRAIDVVALTADRQATTTSPATTVAAAATATVAVRPSPPSTTTTTS